MGRLVMSLTGVARLRHPDAKLLRLSRHDAFSGLRRSALLAVGSIVDELVFPAGAVLVRGHLLATEALLLLRPGDELLDEHGTWTVPACGMSLGLRPWVRRTCHPTTVVAGSDVAAYVVAGPAVRLLLEVTPSPGWSSFEGSLPASPCLAS